MTVAPTLRARQVLLLLRPTAGSYEWALNFAFNTVRPPVLSCQGARWREADSAAAAATAGAAAAAAVSKWRAWRLPTAPALPSRIRAADRPPRAGGAVWQRQPAARHGLRLPGGLAAGAGGAGRAGDWSRPSASSLGGRLQHGSCSGQPAGVRGAGLPGRADGRRGEARPSASRPASMEQLAAAACMPARRATAGRDPPRARPAPPGRARLPPSTAAVAAMPHLPTLPCALPCTPSGPSDQLRGLLAAAGGGCQLRRRLQPAGEPPRHRVRRRPAEPGASAALALACLPRPPHLHSWPPACSTQRSVCGAGPAQHAAALPAPPPPPTGALRAVHARLPRQALWPAGRGALRRRRLGRRWFGLVG